MTSDNEADIAAVAEAMLDTIRPTDCGNAVSQDVADTFSLIEDALRIERRGLARLAIRTLKERGWRPRDLTATVERMRGALEPFARAFGELPNDLTATDEYDECCANLSAPYALEPVTIADLRRALSALASAPPTGKETP